MPISTNGLIFPTSISRDVTGGPSFKTTIVGSGSGYESRIGQYDRPRRSWQIGYAINSEDRLSAIRAMFHVCQGRLYPFLFRDWTDYFAGMALGPDGLGYSAPEQFGTGNGSDTVYQLTKAYSSGSLTMIRKISRPDTTGLKIYVNGVEQVSGVSVSASTGLVTFDVAPPSGHSVAWCGRFWVLARFDTDDLRVSLKGVRAGDVNLSIAEILE